MEKAKRCPKGTSKNKQGECIPKNKTRKSSKIEQTVSAKEIEKSLQNMKENESTIKIPKSTIEFLSKKLNSKSPESFRQIAEKEEMYIPLDDYPENKEMLLYLSSEIMELAMNATRDAKKKSVTSKIVDSVIANDPDLNRLFS